MTMFIDEALLDRVMKLTGLKTKTVEFALREAERKKKLTKFLSRRDVAGIDWKNSVDPGYDLMALRAAEVPLKRRPKRGSRWFLCLFPSPEIGQ
jgi:hypothetical protein